MREDEELAVLELKSVTRVLLGGRTWFPDGNRAHMWDGFICLIDNKLLILLRLDVTTMTISKFISDVLWSIISRKQSKWKILLAKMLN